MKISSLLFPLCLLSAASVPAAAESPVPLPPAGVPAPNPDIPAGGVFFDFFNFDAMKSAGAVGEALREFIFSAPENSSHSASALIAKLNADYGMNLPDSLKTMTVAKCTLADVPVANTAIFEFEDASPRSDAAVFWEKLENRPEPIAGLRELPAELTALIPAGFRGNAERILVSRNPQNNEIAVVASARENAEIAGVRLDAPRGDAANRGKLFVLRAFPRRVPAGDSGEGHFSRATPAGEFMISEENAQVRISLAFRCADGEEAARVRHFFFRFKTSLGDAAKLFGDKEQATMRSVAETISVSEDGNVLRVEMRCPSETFPIFLKQKALWLPRPPHE